MAQIVELPPLQGRHGGVQHGCQRSWPGRRLFGYLRHPGPAACECDRTARRALGKGWHAEGIWGRSGTQDIPASNNASSINDRGQVVGTSNLPMAPCTRSFGPRRAACTTSAPFPAPSPTIAGCCRTVNNRGEVVGFSIDANGMTPFLWKDGKIQDLNTLIPANSTLHLMGAYSINDEGEIAGQACVLPACTEMHAYRANSENGSKHAGGLDGKEIQG